MEYNTSPSSAPDSTVNFNNHVNHVESIPAISFVGSTEPGSSASAVPYSMQIMNNQCPMNIPYSQVSALLKRKRIVICPICAQVGHYEKTCPLKRGDKVQIQSILTIAKQSVDDMVLCKPVTSNESAELTVNEKECEVPVNKVSRKVSKKKFKSLREYWKQSFELRNTGKHTPTTFVRDDKQGIDERESCAVCGVRRVPTKCMTCKVGLHLGCWETFHDKVDPWAKTDDVLR